MEDFIVVKSELTYKQKHYLDVLAEDLRIDYSYALRTILDEHIDEQEKGQTFAIRKRFEQMLLCADWKNMYNLVEEFILLLARNELYNKTRELEQKLIKLRLTGNYSLEEEE